MSSANPELTVSTDALALTRFLNLLAAPCRPPRLAHRLPAMLHKLIFRTTNRMDQHVRITSDHGTYSHISVVGCLFSLPLLAF
jgi:hypothetical protein